MSAVDIINTVLKNIGLKFRLTGNIFYFQLDSEDHYITVTAPDAVSIRVFCNEKYNGTLLDALSFAKLYDDSESRSRFNVVIDPVKRTVGYQTLFTMGNDTKREFLTSFYEIMCAYPNFRESWIMARGDGGSDIDIDGDDDKKISLIPMIPMNL
jgi:hypothetical protein